MPTFVSTVGSGGDFSTLQSWADSFSLDLDPNNARQANCLSGSDLGALTVDSSWVDPIVITVSVGHRHNGTDAGTTGVAYSSGPILFQDFQNLSLLERLRLHDSFGYQLAGKSSDATIQKNMFVMAGAAPSFGAALIYAISNVGDDADFNVDTFNNVVYWKTTSGNGDGIQYVFDVSGDTFTIQLEGCTSNNTVIRTAGTMDNAFNQIQITGGGGGTITGVHQAVNCIALSNSTCFATWSTATSIASDTSAFYANQVAANVVVAPATNAQLKDYPNVAVDNGTFQPGQPIHDDIVDVVRPRGRGWDIGCFESAFTKPAPAGGGGGKFWSGRRR